MGYIPPDVEEYLISYYHEDLTGSELAKKLGLAQRTARRYLSHYRENMTSSPSRVKVPEMRMDAVVFDIETTDFKTEGYAGHLICCSFLPVNSDKVETLQIEFDEHGDDRRLLEEVAKKLAGYSFHIGHNIASFDYNWLNSRLMFHRLPTLNSSFYFDTYQVAKSQAIQTTKSLGNLIDYFGLEGVKTTIYRTSWSKVNSPYKCDFDSAISQIVKHCKLDVAANKRLLDVLHYYSLVNGRNMPWKKSKVQGNFWN